MFPGALRDTRIDPGGIIVISGAQRAYLQNDGTGFTGKRGKRDFESGDLTVIKFTDCP